MVWIIHNCLKIADCAAQIDIVAESLKEIKYPSEIVDIARSRTLGINRKVCIRKKKRKKPKNNDNNNGKNFNLSFVTRYTNNTRDIHRILKKNWEILENNPHLKNRSRTLKTS